MDVYVVRIVSDYVGQYKGGEARHRLKDLIGKARLVNPPCCSVPHIGVGISWLFVWHGGNLVLDA